MFADKAAQGLTFLPALLPRNELWRLKVPAPSTYYTVHFCPSGAGGLCSCLMAPGCPWGAMRGGSCSGLDLCQAALIQERAQERDGPGSGKGPAAGGGCRSKGGERFPKPHRFGPGGCSPALAWVW